MKKLAVSLVVAALLGAPAARAEGSNFPEAVSQFNRGQYDLAAKKFIGVLEQTPRDGLAHYYLALCWHYMGRVPDAQVEYNWVRQNSPDPELQKRVEIGLASLSRFHTQPGAGGMPPQQAVTPTGLPPQIEAQRRQLAAMQASDRFTQPPLGNERDAFTPPPGTTNGATGWLSPTGAAKAAQAVAPPVQPTAAMGQVVDVYTTTCVFCRKFEPLFEQAQMKYGSAVQFQRINAELPQYSRFLRKHRVKGYPTILLLDPAGKLLMKIEGAPQTYEEFEMALLTMYPGLRPPTTAP
jgi:thioredoxin-like negative regulator of GroEL